MTDRKPLFLFSNRAAYGIMALVLVIYGILAVSRHSEQLIWDEGRYMEGAQNLLQGFYVTEKDPDFVNGPGYPIVLMPFAGGPSAWLFARLLNAFFMVGAMAFVWLTVRHYANSVWALVGAILVGLHPTLVWMGFAIMTEPLAMFCITGFMWSFCWAVRAQSWRVALIAAFFLGWLILTRVFFGHVLMATAVLCLGLMVLKEWRPTLRLTLFVLATAFAMCVPYLCYTKAKTGQTLCWSTNSGELLYWMTSNHEGENGHWFSTQDAQEHPDLAPKHDEYYEVVYQKPVLEREAMFKATALANLKADPSAVAYNWVCNVVRLAFGFPRSHQAEELRTIVLIGVNGPLILMAIAGGLIGAFRWRTVPMEVWLMVGFISFYLGGSSLAPSLPRYFVLAVPVLFLATSVVWNRHVRVGLKD